MWLVKSKIIMSKIFIGLVIFILAISLSSCKKRIPTDAVLTCPEIMQQINQVAAIKDPAPEIRERDWNLRDLFVAKCRNPQQ